jgi:ferredoxin
MPEWFTLDDETGRAQARADEVPPDMEGWVVAAVDTCPERAIEVID